MKKSDWVYVYIPIVFLFDIKKIEERKITFFFPCKKFSKKNKLLFSFYVYFRNKSSL